MEKAVHDATALKLAAKSMKSFRKYVALSKQKKKKQNYIESFYHRGLLRRSVTGWRMYARITDKDSLREKMELKLKDYENNFVKGNDCALRE